MPTPPTFTSGSVLTAAQMNQVGLWLVKTQSLTTVTNSITSCFSADFNSYRVVVNNLNNGSTTSRALSIRMGTDATAAYAYGQRYIFGNGSGDADSAGTGQTLGSLGVISSKGGNGFVMDIHNPFLSTPTVWTYQLVTYQADVAAFVHRTGFGSLDTTTSYTGFQIIGTTDNLSGTVQVYGYRS